MNINNPTTFSTPALVYSTSNSSGSAGAIRADDTLAVFSTTAPTNISTSTVSAATGDNAFASREDHVHGSTAVIVAASQAEVEAASSNTLFVTPGRAQYHPGVAKAYCYFIADGTLQTGSYNVASVTKNSTGNYTVAWDEDFADTNYVPIGLVDGSDLADLEWSTFATGSLVINTFVNDTAYDRKTWIAAWGDQ